MCGRTHKKFIFISSVDVYPKTPGPHSEEEDIPLDSLTNFYATTKLMSESIIKNMCPNYLILRCSTLLGHDSRENSLIKIIKEKNPTVTLSPESVFNFILHKDVLAFVKTAIEKDLQGIYNIVSSENITLSQIAELLGKKVTFGKYQYNAGSIDNIKAAKLHPGFQKTSGEVIDEFNKLLI